MITVTDTAVTAVLIGGDWFPVSGVVVDFAEFVAPGQTHTGRGAYMSAVISSGPDHGKTIVAPLASVAAIRV